MLPEGCYIRVGAYPMMSNAKLKAATAPKDSPPTT